MTYWEHYIQEAIKQHTSKAEHSTWYIISSQLAVITVVIVKILSLKPSLKDHHFDNYSGSFWLLKAPGATASLELHLATSHRGHFLSTRRGVNYSIWSPVEHALFLVSVSCLCVTPVPPSWFRACVRSVWVPSLGAAFEAGNSEEDASNRCSQEIF